MDKDYQDVFFQNQYNIKFYFKRFALILVFSEQLPQETQH